ncbi:MAG: 30S ribosomal protein S16 [bacterium]|jgi:small subunit ribosomal protein S16
MAVAIRLSRAGRTNRPYWRIVAMDSRKKRDGACLDRLGTYDPINHKIITFNAEGIQEWVSKGAQCSATVAKLVKQYSASQKSEASVVVAESAPVAKRPRVKAAA